MNKTTEEIINNTGLKQLKAAFNTLKPIMTDKQAMRFILRSVRPELKIFKPEYLTVCDELLRIIKHD